MTGSVLMAELRRTPMKVVFQNCQLIKWIARLEYALRINIIYTLVTLLPYCLLPFVIFTFCPFCKVFGSASDHPREVERGPYFVSQPEVVPYQISVDNPNTDCGSDCLSVSFDCEASGYPQPTYTWFEETAPNQVQRSLLVAVSFLNKMYSNILSFLISTLLYSYITCLLKLFKIGIS